jgi:hypothetical protein
MEALFSELKNQIGLRRLRLRRIKFVREQFYLAARGGKFETPGAVPQHDRATNDGQRIRNKLTQENRSRGRIT